MAIFVSPTAGTRIEPTDSYIFQRGTTVTLKVTFASNGSPSVVDNTTVPKVTIFQPAFIENTSTSTITNVVETVNGSLVVGQLFEYEFIWDIPGNLVPSDQYAAAYSATIGGMFLEYGSELFTVSAGPGQVNVMNRYYATVDDVRAKKFNIDDYLPKVLAKDITARNNLIQSHLRDGTEKLQEELNLHQSRGFSVNYRLFVVYYTIWSVLLASRGDDGSSVSDSNLAYWKSEWAHLLAHMKRQGSAQAIPLGRG